MNRIIMHHTGGPHHMDDLDHQHYHKIVDSDGTVHDGLHPISDNSPANIGGAHGYAAHTLNLNTGSIGISMACMGGAEWSNPLGSTKFFPTTEQYQAWTWEIAKLAAQYGIPITKGTVLSHAEVQPTLHVPQRQKWDYDYDPQQRTKSRDPVAIGDLIRADIANYKVPMDIIADPANNPQGPFYPQQQQGSFGPYVEAIQKALVAYGLKHMDERLTTLKVDGAFGPATRDAVCDFQRIHEMLPDGRVGHMTWAALYPAGIPK
jgi:hypothetical protein